jgi:heme-degrading monooxygenase HmoA
MVVRAISAKLKPNSLAEFERVLEEQVLPILRIQPGFLHQLTLADEGSQDVTILCVWDSKQLANRYETTAYLGVLKKLDHVLAGVPSVQTTRVISSTLQKSASLNAA